VKRLEFMASEIPDFERAWEYENGFHLTSDVTRMGKIIAHWELFKMASDIPGAIVECGVFKGASLARFAAFRQLVGDPSSTPIIGFDTFGRFPETDFSPDKPFRERFVDDAGGQSISRDNLMKVLDRKKCAQNVELVVGDIRDSVPRYVEQNPQLRISLLNLDVDIYEPSVTVLEHLYPRIVKGGILVLDDYGTFPGETKAVDDYFATKGLELKILTFPFCITPCYVVV
jgi:hypothetical protein